MKTSYLSRRLATIPTIAIGLMVFTMAAVASALAIPHRHSSFHAGPPKHIPYAPASKDLAIARKGAHAYEPLHVAAEKAKKNWTHAGWMATGGIERRHFWLTHPLDLAWRGHLFFLARERYFWWHHRRLYHLWWLGQGWEYLHGTTRPSTRASQIVFFENARPSDVALRVHALSILKGLRLTSDQFGSLEGTLAQMSDAGDVVDADVVDNILATNPNCLDTLNQLYKDSVLSNDDDLVRDRERLLELQDKYQVCTDPTVVVTDDARLHAQQIFDLLNPTQIASYVAARAQVVPDVTELIVAGMDQCRKLSDSDFDEYSRCLAERVAVLTTGLDADANEPVIRHVEDMLKQARDLNDDAFAAQRLDFEIEARGIETNCDPIILIDHSIQWDIASFLANPQAKAMTAIRARQIQAPV